MKPGKHLIISGILFTIILFLWPIFMALFQPSGNIERHFDWIVYHRVEFKLQFFFAFLLAPSVLYLMYSQLDRFPTDNRIAKKLGMMFLMGYLVLNSISYASQMILIPKIIEAGLFDQARVWYFNTPNSISYFLNQMGYCFWAIGALILFYRLIKTRGVIKYISIIYIISSTLSIVAFTGLIIENKTINSMTLYSGLALIPIGIMTIIWGIKENKAYN